MTYIIQTSKSKTRHELLEKEAAESRYWIDLYISLMHKPGNWPKLRQEA